MKFVEASYELADSLIALKSVTFAVVAIQFVLICIVDKTLVQLTMYRSTTTIASIGSASTSVTGSVSLDTIDTEPLITVDQPQVTLYYHQHQQQQQHHIISVSVIFESHNHNHKFQRKCYLILTSF